MPHYLTLSALLLALVCLLTACEEMDPVAACNDIAQRHCTRLEDCAPTPQDTQACLTQTRLDLRCAHASNTTSSLSRCESGIDDTTCAEYLMLPSACYGAFSTD
jgi:hypothetical protein